MGLLFWIAFAAGRVVADSPDVFKADAFKADVTKAAAAPAPEVTFKMTHLEGEPLIIRIYYLEDGTREIRVPPVPIHSPDAADDEDGQQPQVVLITNTEAGVQGVLVQP